MSLHRACCCVVCRTDGLWVGCNAFTPFCSSEFQLCVSGEISSNAILNVDTPVTLVENGSSVWVYELATVRRFELEPTTFAGADQSFTIRGYSWSGTAWTLLRTTSSSIPSQGFKQWNPQVSRVWRLWPTKKWFPDTITVEGDGIVPVGLAGNPGAQNCNAYTTVDGVRHVRARSISFPVITLNRSAIDPACAQNDCKCVYSGVGGSVVIDVFADQADCDNDVNAIEQLTLDLHIDVILERQRGVFVEAYPDPAYFTVDAFRDIFEGGQAKAGTLAFACAGETLTFSNLRTTDGHIGKDGTVDIVIPSHTS